MAQTTFVDKTTVIEADWLNDVDAHVYITGNENWGNASDTTDGAGEITIAHGLTLAPDMAQVGIRGDNKYVAKVKDVDATNLTILVIDENGADVATTAVVVDWLARASNT